MTCGLIRSCHSYFALLCCVVTLLLSIVLWSIKFCILLFMICFLLSKAENTILSVGTVALHNFEWDYNMTSESK